MKTLILLCLTMGVAVATVLTIGLFMRNVFDEVSDDAARYSPHRREDYQAQRLRIALFGLVTILLFVVLTAGVAWIL